MGVRSLLATVLASGAAFLFNRAASRGARPGPLLALVLGPGVEETAKTGFALAMAAPVVVVHLGFGAVEAVYDASARLGPGGGPASLSARGLAAGAMSLLSHAAFGAVTQAVLALTLEPFLAVAAAVLVHAVWNLTIVALVGAGGRP
ncbi:MAG: hypothetical protein ACM3X3_04720 [Betaproteobacteria bacterium]